MLLEFKRFQKEYFSEYALWFVDTELNRQLGPMDQEWLDSVLAQSEAEGITWAVFRDEELIAVIENAFHVDEASQVTITALATKPAYRRQGIGTAVLQQLFSINDNKGIRQHIAYIHVRNVAARRCMEGVGFVAVSSEPNQHGYIEFRR